jgi:hypothetical protein
LHTFPAESRDIFDEPFRRVELPIEITYSKIVQHSAPEKPKTSGESLKLALSRTDLSYRLRRNRENLTTNGGKKQIDSTNKAKLDIQTHFLSNRTSVKP